MNYLIVGKTIYNDVKQEIKEKGFPPGIYDVNYNGSVGTVSLTSIKFSYDSLIDLDDSVYKDMINEIQLFFKDDVKEKFKKQGFLYKKSVLLHGKPGTGKTCLLMRISELFIKNYATGIILFDPNISGLKEVLKNIPDNIPVMVIFEEFDEHLQNFGESRFLGILDGEIQRENSFYLFTTNYIEKIPNRLLRPGRMSNVIELTELTKSQREQFFKVKLTNLSKQDLNVFVDLTTGFTIDELKQVVLLVNCLGYDLESSINKIRGLHKFNKKDEEKEEKQLRRMSF